MRSISSFMAIFACVFSVQGQSVKNSPQPFNTTTSLVFTENKGQVRDQYQNPRQDVLFGGGAGRLYFHLRRSGLSYQLLKSDRVKAFDKRVGMFRRLEKAAGVAFYRVDMEWVGASANALIETGGPLEAVSNYFLAGCGEGIEGVRSYAGVTYRNIYPGIDLKFYEKEGALKYDFIVSPGADPGKIRIRVKGAGSIVQMEDGSLLLITPFGEINEGAPFVYQQGRRIAASWKVEGNDLCFRMSGYDRSLPLVIDPSTRVWGTYFGGSGEETGYSCVTDAGGNVYQCGSTEGATGTVIATSGAHQTSFAGGIADAFLVKYNAAGQRQWATYYGDSGWDFAFGCATDGSGNVYISGATEEVTSSTVLATQGAHQVTGGGGFYDAFLVKFNGSGVRQWGSYYGGSSDEYGFFCSTDNSGNVLMTGFTDTGSGTAIATSGAHQTSNGGFFDGFLVKFNSAGARQWGTYYGDSGFDISYGCSSDGSGNIYFSGTTDSNSGISTSGSHQQSHGGLNDGFLVKFNASGVRQWATYYGDAGDDEGRLSMADNSGNIYLAGATDATSGTVIATSGAHQASPGGGFTDGYLVKFNTSGIRQWGTYYGGNGDDSGFMPSVNAGGQVFFSGQTTTSGGTAIATSNGHQTGFGGGNTDAFLAEFTANGARVRSTYYGGSGDEDGFCAAGPSGEVYLSGSTTSAGGTVIASPGSHQTAHGGNAFGDGFLAKFGSCNTVPASPVNVTPASALQVCEGYTTVLVVTGSGAISWYVTPTGTLSAGTGSVLVTPTLSAGTYTWYAEAFDCSVSVNRTPVTVTVFAAPSVSVMAPASPICSGKSTTISALGASSYTWSGPGASGNNSFVVVQPVASSVYTVTGSGTNSCTSSQLVQITVQANLTVNVASSNTLLCAGSPATLTAGGASTYTWTGSASGTGAQLTITPTANSTYTLTGSDGNCTGTAVFTQSVSGCLGVSRTSSQGFRVYPNPGKGEFWIESPSGTSYVIHNVLGQEVCRGDLNAGVNRIRIESASKGVYLLSLANGEQVKILVE